MTSNDSQLLVKLLIPAVFIGLGARVLDEEPHAQASVGFALLAH